MNESEITANFQQVATNSGLSIPDMISDGKIQSLQFINPDGSKRFLSGGAIAGNYYAIGGKPDECLLVCEGYATGASLFEATGFAVAIAFNAGNLKSVSLALRGILAKRYTISILIA